MGLGAKESMVIRYEISPEKKSLIGNSADIDMMRD